MLTHKRNSSCSGKQDLIILSTKPQNEFYPFIYDICPKPTNLRLFKLMTSTKGVSGTESASKILAFNSCQKNFEYEASIDNCITEAETKDFNVVNATR